MPLQTSFGCICRKVGYSFLSIERTGLYDLISIVTVRLTANVEVRLHIMKHLCNSEFFLKHVLVFPVYQHFYFQKLRKMCKSTFSGQCLLHRYNVCRYLGCGIAFTSLR